MQLQSHVMSHFPCGERSFRTTIVNSDNAPEIQIGDSIVVDPDVTPRSSPE